MKQSWKFLFVILVVALLALPFFAQAQGDAIPIALGDTVSGALEADSPQVLYTFTGSAGVFVEITLESDDFDAYLVLQDAAGEDVAQFETDLARQSAAVLVERRDGVRLAVGRSVKAARYLQTDRRVVGP